MEVIMTTRVDGNSVNVGTDVNNTYNEEASSASRTQAASARVLNDQPPLIDFGYKNFFERQAYRERQTPPRASGSNQLINQ
jgi:hypothetical protein